MSSTITSIRVTNGTNERIKKIAKEYSKISVDITLEFILDYLERNNIDLNFDVKNEFYSDLKINQNKFDDFELKLFFCFTFYRCNKQLYSQQILQLLHRLILQREYLKNRNKK